MYHHSRLHKVILTSILQRETEAWGLAMRWSPATPLDLKISLESGNSLHLLPEPGPDGIKARPPVP
jgi:hypothetical protein